MMMSEIHQLNAKSTWTTTTLPLLAPGKAELAPLSHAAIARIGEGARLVALCELTHVTLVHVSISAARGSDGAQSHAGAMSVSPLASFAVGATLLFNPVAGVLRPTVRGGITPSWHIPVLQQLALAHSVEGTPCDTIE
jgi:hypothetical protein